MDRREAGFADVAPGHRDASTRPRSRPRSPTRTVGIVAVDVFGQPADYDELRAIADKHGLFLIEDAACSAGATLPGPARPAASATSATFCFHGRKGITAGEGGRWSPTDEALAAHARKLHTYGIEGALARGRADDLPIPLRRARLQLPACPTCRPAIMLVQLDRLPTLLAARARVAARYAELLDGLRRWSSCRSSRGPRPTRGSRTSSPSTPGLDRGGVAIRAAGARRPVHVRHLRVARPAVYGQTEAVPRVGRPVRPAPGDPDARQPDRRPGGAVAARSAKS